MATKQDCLQLISQGHYKKALELLDEIIRLEPTDDEAYFHRGKLKWRMGDRPGATGDYATAVSINPSSPAVTALEQARDVADFFNPDLYNP